MPSALFPFPHDFPTRHSLPIYPHPLLGVSVKVLIDFERAIELEGPAAYLSGELRTPISSSSVVVGPSSKTLFTLHRLSVAAQSSHKCQWTHLRDTGVC